MGWYYGTVGDDSVSGSEYNDYVYGGPETYGGQGRDTLFGLQGNDSLFGGASADTIDGGAGNDWLEGGANNDLYLFTGAFGQDYISNEYGGTNTIRFADLNKSQVTYEVDEGNLIIRKIGSTDRVEIENGEYYKEYFTFQFKDGSGTPTSGPTPGNDTLSGTAGVDSIDALAGNDTVFGAGATDTLDGNEGNDLLYGELGNDRLIGGLGNDRMYGGDGNDILGGTTGVDTIYGDAGNDTLWGGGAADPSIDRLFGGTGNDLASGDTGSDTIYGGAGLDSLAGVLDNDYLYGDAGNDILDGGRGRDTMTGGTGADDFVFATPDSGIGAARDRIMDFKAGEGDRIDLEHVDANLGQSGDQDFVWKGTAALTGAGQAGYYISGGQTIIRASLDADAAAEFEIQLGAGLTPTAGWFDL
jgi:Ca2+-binding RTX toxin-like protein